jgi:tRNA(fMet)-specific endonuclease VapC
MAVLDTTAFSAAMRREPGILEFLRSRGPAGIAAVPAVVAEIQCGIARLEPGSRRRNLFEFERDRLLGALTVLPWTDESSRTFGALKTQLERDGVPVDDFDIAIEAIASSHGAEVVTANLPHFSRFSGLACRHWTGAGG